jgi:UDP-glucose 4-epimerase
VLEVVEAVKRVSGVDFKVEIAPRRAGDPARIVADSRQARTTLGWQPSFDDLSNIVAHALAWERELVARRAACPNSHLLAKPTARQSQLESHLFTPQTRG